MTTIQVRTTAKQKKAVQKILKQLGLDMSTAINMYLMQIVLRGGIPFPILTENGMTPEMEEELLKEIEEAKKSKKFFRSGEEVIADILKE